MASNQFQSIWNQSNKKPRDLADKWFKFTHVGDRVCGIVRDIFEKEPEGKYSGQHCFTLEQEDGTYINVGVKDTKYNVAHVQDVMVGDMLGVEFVREIASKQGLSAAKSMAFYITSNTVQSLDDDSQY